MNPLKSDGVDLLVEIEVKSEVNGIPFQQTFQITNKDHHLTISIVAVHIIP